MTIIISGRKLEVRSNEVPIQKQDGTYAFPRKVDVFKTKAKINPQKYALILEGDQVKSAISMIQGINGLNCNNTNTEALKQGLLPSTMRQFMLTYQTANQAVEGRAVLYDASGNLIEGERRGAYVHTLNHDHWAWLNAGFPKGAGFKGLDLSVITGVDPSGQTIIKRVPLENCLESDGWADLESLNSQGFPTKKAKIEAYEPGKTFYFWSPILRTNKPEEGYVARVNANSDGLNVYCDGHREHRLPRLGVFPCAEGVAEN